MTVVDLAARRLQRAAAADLPQHFLDQLADEFALQAIEVAELADPVIEPFRCAGTNLDQHLQGAFLRWQVEQVKAALADKAYRARMLPLAIEATVQAFSDRMLELQHGYDPRGGDAA